MPAPGPPRVPPRVASRVIRSHLVPPDGMFSGCAAPVTCVSVTARPVAVVTTSRVATGRGMSSSSRTDAGRQAQRLVEVDLYPLSVGVRLASVQALAGSPSKA